MKSDPKSGGFIIFALKKVAEFWGTLSLRVPSEGATWW
jgi:hypothetical protein